MNFFFVYLDQKCLFKAFVLRQKWQISRRRFVFIGAILHSAAPGLRTIKGEVLDIFL